MDSFLLAVLVGLVLSEAIVLIAWIIDSIL